MPLGTRLDPTPNFKYGVKINGTLMAGFMSCSGLELSREVKEVVEGGINDHVHMLPGPLKQSRITMRRGITTTKFLWDWLHAGMTDIVVKRLSMDITLYATDGTVVRTWSVLNAYPTKWSGSELKSDSNEAAIETIEFAHSGIQYTAGGALTPA